MARAEMLLPVDLAVALRIAHKPEEPYEELSGSLSLALSAAHRSVTRLQKAQLLEHGRRSVLRDHLAEFVISGLRYVFYPELGSAALGVPTADIQDLSDGGAQYVWPSGVGTHRGQSIKPLFPQAVELPGRDPDVYEALRIVDSIRIGRQRERVAAAAAFRSWLGRSEPRG